MKPLIKPPNAASIWSVGDLIYLELPSPTGTIAHTIRVANDLVGLSKVFAMLKQRESDSHLGEAGDLTQAQMDKLKPKFKSKVPTYDLSKVRRAAEKPRFDNAQIASAESVLKRLGML